MNCKALRNCVGDFTRFVCNYIPLWKLSPAAVNPVLIKFDDKIYSTNKKLLVQKCPWIVRIMDGLKHENRNIPTCFYDLVKDIASQSQKLIEDLIKHRKKSPEIPIATDKHQTLFNKPATTGTHYGYEVQHIRPKYDFPSEYKKIKKKKKHKIKESDHNGDDGSGQFVGNCNKHFAHYKAMNNGIIVARCLEHYQNVGWNVMKEPESVDEYFSLLLMIYPGLEHPDTFIIDNPCNLSPYCMYREPAKFMNMDLWTDEWHGLTGHKCGPLHSVALSKQLSSKLSKLNDSSIEQMNRALKLLSSSTSYMSLESFASNITIMLEIWNRRQIRKCQNKPIY